MICPIAMALDRRFDQAVLRFDHRRLGRDIGQRLDAERARPAAMPSSNSPTANRKTTSAASSVAPMMTAPMTAMAISISMVKIEPEPRRRESALDHRDGAHDAGGEEDVEGDLGRDQRRQIGDGDQPARNEDEPAFRRLPPVAFDRLGMASSSIVAVMACRRSTVGADAIAEALDRRRDLGLALRLGQRDASGSRWSRRP